MLRDGVPGDADAIERIRIAAWQVAYQEFMPGDFLSNLNALQNVDGLRKRLSSQDHDFSVSVVETDDSVVAFAIMGKPRYEAPGDIVELWALNVQPEYWRKGIGSQLTKRAIESARVAGFKNIELWCINGNQPAETAYKQAGFSPTGKERTSSSLTGHPIHERHYTKKL